MGYSYNGHLSKVNMLHPKHHKNHKSSAVKAKMSVYHKKIFIDYKRYQLNITNSTFSSLKAVQLSHTETGKIK